MIRYSVVIPTLGQLSHLRNLLKSLENLNAIESSEILVVQNPASDHVRILFEEFPNLNIKVLFSPAGVNHARNAGLREASGDYVFFLDDDCRISEKNFFSIHEQAHQTNPWAYAVGGFYKNINPSPLAKAYGEIQKEWLETNQLSLDGECSTLLGGHFSIQRQKGLTCRFDETIRYGGAETEFFCRLKQQGFRFFLIDLVIEHDPRLNIFSFIRKAHLQGRTHRRLMENQLFTRPTWVHGRSLRPDFYRKIYYRIFHQAYNLKFAKEVKSLIKRRLVRAHQALCFYLSNKDLF